MGNGEGKKFGWRVVPGAGLGIVRKQAGSKEMGAGRQSSGAGGVVNFF